MSEEFKMIKELCQSEMDKSLQHLAKELGSIQAGKANPKMLESVSVDYYGNMSPLNQVSSIKSRDARTLLVTPWEKGMLQAIEQAILAANIGITPQNDGESVILNIPALTEERRKDLVKQIKAEGENARIGLRSARKSANDEIKKLKDGGLSEDQAKDAESEIQDLTNAFGKKVEKMLDEKESEIMTV